MLNKNTAFACYIFNRHSRNNTLNTVEEFMDCVLLLKLIINSRQWPIKAKIFQTIKICICMIFAYNCSKRHNRRRIS